MVAPNRPLSQTKYPEQYMGNASYDMDFNLNMVEPVGYDGVSIQRPVADSLSTKLVESGNVTYIARSAPGTAESAAKWQVMKLDDTSGLTVTWADSNADFDNVATDLASLTYG